MDTQRVSSDAPDQGKVIDQSEMARVNDAADQSSPTEPPANRHNLPGGPYAPYTPYATYQPGQVTEAIYPTPTAPTSPPAPLGPLPGRPQEQGLRANNPGLWAVLLVLGVLVGGAIILSVAALLFAARIIGNISTAQVGQLQNESRSVPLSAVKSVDVELTMGAGNLKVTGGATDLLNADFSYNVAQWKPEIASSVAGESGVLSISQPEQGIFAAGKTINKWDVRLNNGVPLSLKANVGAGDTEFRLTGMNITRAEIIVGAGNTTVDMTGMAGQNTDIRVINSVGNSTLVLPSDVGVKVTLARGVGNLDTGTLKGGGNTYTNETYGKSARTINLYVEVAAGNVVFQSR